MMLLWLALGGCRHLGGPRVKTGLSTLQQRVDVSGAWRWNLVTSAPEQGTERHEEELWYLEQHGAAVKGYYDRRTVLRSTDERLFRCSEAPWLERRAHVEVEGHLEGERLRLDEKSYRTVPGPCEHGARQPAHYTGRVFASSIELSWGPGEHQTLLRSRSEKVARVPDVPAVLEGTWQWQMTSTDADGDERFEQEEWHLTEGEEGIRGDYQRRVVHRRSGRGLFRCSGSDRFETNTQFEVTGQRQGQRISLTEVRAWVSAPEEAAWHRCDNGLRHLDSYLGTLSPSGDELVLSSAAGYQLLRRKR